MGNFRGQYYESVSATATNSAVTLGFPARMLILSNDGNNECFFTLVSDTATTSDAKLEVGQTLTFTALNPDDVCSSLGIICSAAETATVRVFAWR